MTHKEALLLEQAYQKVLESQNVNSSGFEGDLEKDEALFYDAYDAVNDNLRHLEEYRYHFEGEDMSETDYWQTAAEEAYELCKISPEYLNRLDKNGVNAERIKASGQSYDKDTIELHINLAIDSKKLRELISKLAELLAKKHFADDDGEPNEDFDGKWEYPNV